MANTVQNPDTFNLSRHIAYLRTEHCKSIYCSSLQIIPAMYVAESALVKNKCA